MRSASSKPSSHPGLRRSVNSVSIAGPCSCSVAKAASPCSASRTLKAGFRQHFDQRLSNEPLILNRQTTGGSLFFVASGTLEITIQRPGEVTHVAYRLAPGEAVGTVGLITGSSYAATAPTLTSVRAYRLDRLRSLPRWPRCRHYVTDWQPQPNSASWPCSATQPRQKSGAAAPGNVPRQPAQLLQVTRTRVTVSLTGALPD